MDATGITDPHGKWNPYYIHLSGNYTEEELADATQLIRVWSVEKDNADELIFDKNLIKTHPKTAAVYKIPNQEYFNLEERYPQHRGLIRTIAYPIPSIDEAIAAPNLTLLAYDASLLEKNERESIITCLKDFLDMCRTRWYINEYTYEDMYAVTFWCEMWQMLPMVLLNQRFKNIRTPNAHSFHVWEYLISKGLGDYRDVLTTSQSLWLYRNINYIRQNEGKQRTLELLAKNLLGEAHASLLYKDILQNTTGYTNNLVTTPEIVSFALTNNKTSKVEPIDAFNERLVRYGLETNNEQKYVSDLSAKLGGSPYNKLSTKFLELKKHSIDTSDTSLMIRVYLDNLIHRLVNNKLSYRVSLLEALKGNLFKLYVGDMFLLWYWSVMRSCGYEDFPIPRKYTVQAAVPFDKPTVNDLNEPVRYMELNHMCTSDVDVQAVIDAFEYTDKTYVVEDDFATFASKSYNSLMQILRHHDASNKWMYHVGLQKVVRNLLVKEELDLSFINYNSWEEFFATNAGIGEVIKMYEDQKIPYRYSAYTRLATACFDKIFETEESKTGAANVRKIEMIYNSVAKLFVSLGSYNITFMTDNRLQSEYIKNYDPDVVIFIKAITNANGFFNFTIEDYYFNRFDTVTIKKIASAVFAASFKRTKLLEYIDKKLDIDISVDKKTTKNVSIIQKIEEPDVTVDIKVIKLHFTINIGNVSCRKI
jgi:hypothetical protein